MGLTEDIRRLYREQPNISSKEIIARLGVKPNRDFWRILEHEQVTLRGLYPGKRRNSHAHNKAAWKGEVRFIPPKQQL